MSAHEFETSDAAYVLGSLSEQERLAFEEHLKTCDRCPARVSEVRALFGLLTLAPVSAFHDNAHEYPLGETSPEAPMPETLLPRLLRQLRRERGRRRLVAAVAVALALAAACVVAVLAVVLPRHGDVGDDPFQPPSQAVAMTNSAGASISAEVQVTTKDTWAQVNLWCTYGVRGFDPGDYEAVAHTTSGQRVVIGSWPGVPGNTAIIRTRPVCTRPTSPASNPESNRKTARMDRHLTLTSWPGAQRPDVMMTPFAHATPLVGPPPPAWTSLDGTASAPQATVVAS